MSVSDSESGSGGSPRRRAILAAALECFASYGYEKTTMEDIRARAGASIGSIYHHFRSKQELASALYLDAVLETQRVVLAALSRERGARRGVRALVSAYLDWVVRHPELAGYLLSMRRAEFVEAIEGDLDAANRSFRHALAGWLAPHTASGALPRLDADLYLALLVGPCELWARRWLRGRATTSPARARRQLGDAAWAALHALA